MQRADKGNERLLRAESNRVLPQITSGDLHTYPTILDHRDPIQGSTLSFRYYPNLTPTLTQPVSRVGYLSYICILGYQIGTP